MAWMSKFVVSNPPPREDLPSLASGASSASSSSTCLVDTFRHVHPTKECAYTCWSTIHDCRKTNFGTRIDYILVSASLTERVQQAEVWQHVMGSDHCPVFAELKIDPKCALAPRGRSVPSLCSDFFSAKQSNLFSFSKSTAKDKDGATAPQIPEKNLARQPEASRTALSPRGTKRPSQSSSTIAPKKAAKSGVQLTFASFLSKSKKAASVESSAVALTEDNLASSQETSTGNSCKAASRTQKLGSAPAVQAPPPRCKGHSEPCVLRKVKKAGPNKDREFWVCARPMGGKSDPEARCNFFLWASKP